MERIKGTFSRKVNAVFYGAVIVLIFCVAIVVLYLPPMLWWKALLFAALIGLDITFVAVFEPQKRRRK